MHRYICKYIYIYLYMSHNHRYDSVIVIYLSRIRHTAPALPNHNIKDNAANSKVNPAISK